MTLLDAVQVSEQIPEEFTVSSPSYLPFYIVSIKMKF